MTADLKPYPAYKDSGVPWLGQIPKQWWARRNGQLFAQRSQTGFPDLPILEVSIATGVRARNLESPRQKQMTSDRDKYKLARRGDIVYNMMRMWQGAVGVSPLDGLVSPSYVVAKPSLGSNVRYFQYVFRTELYMTEVNALSRGIVPDRNRLYWEDFRQIHTPFPPLAEQSLIVRFLDCIGRRIWRYARAKQKLVKLLEEQKQALIIQAVTRGLDPNVQLKPSGVKWLDEIPAHWEMRRLKTMCTMKSGGSIDGLSINPTGDYPVYGGNGVRGYTSSYTHDGDFVLIGRQGALCGNIHLARGRFWASEHAIVASPHSGHLPSWFSAILAVMNLNQYSIAAQPGLAVERVLNLSLPVPPADEQARIAQHIEQDTTAIIKVIRRTQLGTNLLQEYRNRLIADVVTGKLDVRKAASRLPVDPEEPDQHDGVLPLAEGDGKASAPNLAVGEEVRA